jgi:hypothetical protein
VKLHSWSPVFKHPVIGGLHDEPIIPANEDADMLNMRTRQRPCARVRGAEYKRFRTSSFCSASSMLSISPSIPEATVGLPFLTSMLRRQFPC